MSYLRPRARGSTQLPDGYDRHKYHGRGGDEPADSVRPWRVDVVAHRVRRVDQWLVGRDTRYYNYLQKWAML